VAYTVDYKASIAEMAEIYQIASVCNMIAQQPTFNKGDEQWVLGYGLFVNTLVHSYLGIQGEDDRAAKILKKMKRFSITLESTPKHIHEGFFMKNKPYFALWSYIKYSSE